MMPIEVLGGVSKTKVCGLRVNSRQPGIAVVVVMELCGPTSVHNTDVSAKRDQ